MAWADDANNNCSFINEQSPVEVTSKPLPTTGIMNDGSLEKDGHGENENVNNAEEGDPNDGLGTMSEKLSAALVNVNAKEDLVKQHARVAEEAIAGTTNVVNDQ